MSKQNGIARIFVSEESGVERKHAGMGIVVDPYHILTCCHVLNDALRRDKLHKERPRQDQTFAISFPYADDARAIGRVVEWGFERESSYDVAVLCLERKTPHKATFAEFSRADV